MLQLPKRLSLNLPDALASHRELLPDLFQRVISAVLPSPPDRLRAALHADAEAHSEHTLLAKSASVHSSEGQAILAQA
jgi:hypothetical protein